MPGGGAIGFALGAEYRKERNGRTTDPLVKAGLTNQAATQDYKGGYHVTEFFGELSIPVLTDMPFAQLLSLEGAVRHAYYSHARPATSWKAARKRLVSGQSVSVRGELGGRRNIQ